MRRTSVVWSIPMSMAGFALIVGLVLMPRFARAEEEPVTDPAVPGEVETPDMLGDTTPSAEDAPGFVAEVLDSTFLVGPAEFMGLDLPVRSGDAVATHLFGNVTVVGSGRRDIIVRLFRSSDYANWLKKRGGIEARPLFVSGRARDVAIDQDLPPGEQVVLLLDNGYSVRTAKRVRCQLQIRFGEGLLGVPAGATGGKEGAATTGRSPEYDDTLPPPRSNEDESIPPPPPPPDEN